MTGKTLKRIALLTVVIASLVLAYFLGVSVTKRGLNTIWSIQTEKIASEQLSERQQDVIEAVKTGNRELIEWSLVRYDVSLERHIELSLTKEWYSLHRIGLLFERAVVTANLAHLYKIIGLKEKSDAYIQAAMELLLERNAALTQDSPAMKSRLETEQLNDPDFVYSLTKGRLFFKPSEIENTNVN